MKSLKNILQNSDDYAKILIVVWLKIRDIYLDPYDSSNSSIQSKISINTRIKKALKFIRTIKKQCIKLNRCSKLINILSFLEVELTNSKNFLEKITQITTIAQMFDIPKPLNDLIDILGLNQAADNDFAKEINNMFENIDDIDLQQNLNKIDETLNEGTLANFLKNKDKILDDEVISAIENPLEKRNVKINFNNSKKTTPEPKKTTPEPKKTTPEPKKTFTPSIKTPLYNPKSLNISPIHHLATPNPRTAYRKH